MVQKLQAFMSVANLGTYTLWVNLPPSTALCGDMWVAEAGNRPFGYDPHSYTSHQRQQLLQKSAKNHVMGCVVSFGQTLEPKRLKICQEMNLWPFCQWEVVWHMWLSCVRCGILMLDHWNQKMPKQPKNWLVMVFCQVWGKWDLLHTSFSSHLAIKLVF